MKISAILSAIIAVFIFAATAHSAEPEPTRTEGYAPATMPGYKSLALDLALKNAVEQTLADQFGKEQVRSAQPGLEANVYGASKGFATSYRILSEGSINHSGDLPPMPGSWLEKIERTPSGVELYHVWVEVTLDKERLKKTAGSFIAGVAETRKAVITVYDAPGFEYLDSIKTAMENTGAVHSLVYASFSRGKAVFHARVGKTGVLQSMQTALKGSHIVTEDQPNVFSIKPQKAGNK